MPRKKARSRPKNGNQSNTTLCQTYDRRQVSSGGQTSSTSLGLNSTSHSSPTLTRDGTKQSSVNTPIAERDILHMIDQAAQSGSPQEMLECFNQLIHTENKVNQESLDQGLLLSCRYGREFLVQILIFHGANIETRDDDGNTPLLICAEKGFTDIALLLVDKGADINSYNKDGDTALLLSIQTSGSSELVRRLLDNDKHDLKMDHKNKNGCNALMKAIGVLNLPLINILIKKQTDVKASVSNSACQLAESLGFKSLLSYMDRRTHNRKTTLQNAVSMKDKYIIKLLLACRIFVFSDSYGEDNNIVFGFLNSILESKQVITEDDLDIVQILLKAGAPLKSDHCYNRSECVLNLSIRIGSYDLVEMLCRHGADVNKQNYYYSYNSPLVVAAEVGRCDIIELLLDRGAKISQDSCPALQSAIKHEQIDCAKFLIHRGAKINVSAALTSVVSGNKIESFVFLNEQFKSDVSSQIRQIGTQLLNIASEKGYTEMIRLLVQEGANVNASHYYKSPLMSTKDPNVMELLIELGADVNVIVEKYGNSYSALTFTLDDCERGCTIDNLLERVNVLLQNGANVNVEDKLGNTPLMDASQKSDMEKVLRALLQAGANVNQKNNNGESALYFAANLESIANAKVLLEFKADINLKNNTGQTPLFNLLLRPCTQMIKFMLENKANVNDVDNNGDTSLLYVCSSRFQDPFEVVRLLIKAGASVNHQNNEGYTPLMLAAKQQHVETMKVLCEASADVNLVNEKKNETALSALISKGLSLGLDTESMLYLIENGADSSCVSPDVIHQLILNEENGCLKQIISLGVGPKDVDLACVGFGDLSKGSPLCASLCCGSINVARFLNEIWFLTHYDISRLAYNEQLRKSLESNKYSECLEFLDEYSSQPLSLQKLSFVAVSSAVGADAGRKERVQRLPIPNTFKDKLVFKHAEQAELAADPKVQDISMLERLAMIHLLNNGFDRRQIVYHAYQDEYSSHEYYNSDSDY
ncbi:ankyrin repeat and KH domain-containing protein 1-like [Physella acuta]|uniref:ankyrin repeat and KH domain-containing protein 1-like n=1 Tax=Physella acuta TaxID=109671 RepID=UPI0027DC0722|nr:ankyrin repeat and KH domain-containing protein 1-like [Physella acuta]